MTFGREVEPCLDLDAVGVEVHHLLHIDALGAFEIAVFDRVDLARIRAMYQWAAEVESSRASTMGSTAVAPPAELVHAPGALGV